MMAKIDFQIGTSAIRNYKRLDYEFWYALAEYVDNSAQSYANNKEILDKQYTSEGESLEVIIFYDNKQGFLRIRDNAMGMDLQELENALEIGKAPKNTSGLSEFGMGLKTASCWIGDVWSIKTKKLGSDKEYEVTFDVERVANGETNIDVIERPKPKDDHYTIIEIHKMHQKIAGNTIQKVKTYLRSMYRVHTRLGIMKLKWGNDEVLSYDEDIKFLKARNGESFKRDFDFIVDGKRVYGWGGILEKGGRPRAGFAVVRRNRIIEGQPTAWRPHEIYGQEQGSNDLVNQRIVGEIHLDDFMVTHTKNKILWQGEQEEIVEKKLYEAFADFVDVALNAKYRGGELPESVLAAGVAQAAADLQNPNFVDSVVLNEVPSPDFINASNQPILEATKNSRPDEIIKIGDVTVNLYIDPSYSPSEPYYVSHYGPNLEEITVAINSQHVFFKEHITTSESVHTYILLCCYDALAEWKCLFKTGSIDAKTVNSIKDQFMKTNVSRS